MLTRLKAAGFCFLLGIALLQLLVNKSNNTFHNKINGENNQDCHFGFFGYFKGYYLFLDCPGKAETQW